MEKREMESSCDVDVEPGNGTNGARTVVVFHVGKEKNSCRFVRLPIILSTPNGSLVDPPSRDPTFSHLCNRPSRVLRISSRCAAGSIVHCKIENEDDNG